MLTKMASIPTAHTLHPNSTHYQPTSTHEFPVRTHVYPSTTHDKSASGLMWQALRDSGIFKEL